MFPAAATAAYKAALAATGVGERWLVPPRLALTDAEVKLLTDQLTALDVRDQEKKKQDQRQLKWNGRGLLSNSKPRAFRLKI